MDFISELDPYAALFGGAAMGALISSFFAFFNEWMRRRFEDRKHRRELGVTAALKNWELDLEMARKRADLGYGMQYAPLDVYLAHMLVLVDSLGSKKLNPKNVGELIRRAKGVSNAAGDACPEQGN